MDLGFLHVRKLLVPLENDSAGERGRKYRRIAERVQQMLDRADVVVVPVRDHDAAHVFAAGLEIFNVGDEIINPGHVFIRPLEPHVYDDDIVFIFVYVAGAGYFSASAERDKAKTPFFVGGDFLLDVRQCGHTSVPHGRRTCAAVAIVSRAGSAPCVWGDARAASWRTVWMGLLNIINNVTNYLAWYEYMMIYRYGSV